MDYTLISGVYVDADTDLNGDVIFSHLSGDELKAALKSFAEVSKKPKPKIVTPTADQPPPAQSN